jgi:phosphoribosyl-ATP pyrophosphohydrolase
MGLLTHCVNPLILNSRYYPPMTDSISRLHVAIKAARAGDPATSRTARLLQGGRSKVAKKLGEEAVEVVIDAMAGSRENVVRESADLLYNLVALWTVLEVDPKEVWSEMDRRERLFGIAEKLPKHEAKARRKVTPFPIRRAAKRG